MVQKSLLIPSIIICPNSFAELMLLDWGITIFNQNRIVYKNAFGYCRADQYTPWKWQRYFPYKN
ncbi:hypothetical protein [Pedobacter sp. UYP1]|uniref:hypothetical protein n=1 Tax=Pedobacter sp. UYP1 TaxID=1756396 RepID=UPI0033909E17